MVLVTLIDYHEWKHTTLYTKKKNTNQYLLADGILIESLTTTQKKEIDKIHIHYSRN
jgi:hypothetical protein